MCKNKPFWSKCKMEEYLDLYGSCAKIIVSADDVVDIEISDIFPSSNQMQLI